MVFIVEQRKKEYNTSNAIGCLILNYERTWDVLLRIVI
jgi:hypothetical protein